MTADTVPGMSLPAWSWPHAGRTALRDLLPALLALAPLALVVGVTVGRSGVGALIGIAGAPAIYAASAQLSALTLLGAGAGLGTILASVAVINARLVMYAAVLEPRFRSQPGWFRWLGPHFLVDPAFVLVTAREDLADGVRFRRYWLSLGGLLATAWTALVALGVALGPALSRFGPALAFAPAACFLAMLVPRITRRPDLAAALVSGAATAALTLTHLLPPGAPILIGAGAGVLAAVATRRPS
jgi:predicted branched-subunit amino acid permease